MPFFMQPSRTYTVCDELSKEGATALYTAIDSETGETVVVKMPQSLDCRQTTVEAEVLRVVSHRSIIQLKDVVQTECGPALILPYCEYGDLLNRVSEGPLSEPHAKIVIFHILNALVHLHSQGIVHRDIKPDNIFMVSSSFDDVVLGDFGVACVLDADGYAEGQSGSLSYAAPELLSGWRYTEKVDIWSLGITMFGLLTGRFLYAFQERKARVRSIREAVDRLGRNPYIANVSEGCKRLLGMMLQMDPRQRIDASQALQHEWFQLTENPEKLVAPPDDFINSGL
jgi:serine/threonine protein kinase